MLDIGLSSQTLGPSQLQWGCKAVLPDPMQLPVLGYLQLRGKMLSFRKLIFYKPLYIPLQISKRLTAPGAFSIFRRTKGSIPSHPTCVAAGCDARQRDWCGTAQFKMHKAGNIFDILEVLFLTAQIGLLVFSELLLQTII